MCMCDRDEETRFYDEYQPDNVNVKISFKVNYIQRVLDLGNQIEALAAIEIY